MVFDDFDRTDATPSGHDEPRFDFLNRSASKYFADVREVVESWFSHVPPGAQSDLRGALRGDDRQSASAFWELLLHEAYLRSGYTIEIHPDIVGSTTHPDFKLSNADGSWYLECVSVGSQPRKIAEERRLNAVYQILAEFQIEDFAIEVSHYGIGPSPLATRKLRGELTKWISNLDIEVVMAAVSSRATPGFDSLPEFLWSDSGWQLTFHAIPLAEHARGKPRSALGVLGPGEAVAVDNVTGLLRVLDSKRSKYGTLDAPLIIALQSNTHIPTKEYEVEEALFGRATRRSPERADHLEELGKDGFWLTKRGWTNGHVPQIVVVRGLSPWNVVRANPEIWETFEPGVVGPTQPPWPARIEFGADARACPPVESLSDHLGLDPNWPGDDPDFSIE